MPPTFVTNSTTPIAFARAGQLALLHRLCGELTIAPGVRFELCEKGADRAANSLFRRATQPGTGGWIHVESLASPDYADALIGAYHFDRGEAETLALAVELEPDYVVVDEGRAWEAAEEICPHLAVIALPWLLDEAQVRGLIPSALEALRQFEMIRPPAGEPAYRSAYQVRQAHLRYRASGGMGLPPKPH